MMSEQQQENYILQLLRANDNLANQISNLVSIVNTLQNQVNGTSSGSSSGSSDPGSVDTYKVGTSILHKLATTFNGLVTLVSSAAFPSLTASRPLKLTSGGVATATQIVLSSNNDISGTLGVVNGGTNGTTQASARTGISAAALPQTIAGSNFNVSTGPTACGGTQNFTINGSNFTAPVGGGACSGSQSVTINGSNFTFTLSAVPASGSQALV